jgi:hypothetical protein
VTVEAVARALFDNAEQAVTGSGDRREAAGKPPGVRSHHEQGGDHRTGDAVTGAGEEVGRGGWTGAARGLRTLKSGVGARVIFEAPDNQHSASVAKSPAGETTSNCVTFAGCDPYKAPGYQDVGH